MKSFTDDEVCIVLVGNIALKTFVDNHVFVYPLVNLPNTEYIFTPPNDILVETSKYLVYVTPFLTSYQIFVVLLIKSKKPSPFQQAISILHVVAVDPSKLVFLM